MNLYEMQNMCAQYAQENNAFAALGRIDQLLVVYTLHEDRGELLVLLRYMQEEKKLADAEAMHNWLTARST